MVSEQWIVQNVEGEGTGRALILSITSVFARISSRELQNV
jgi:hypothetical protein